MKFDPFSWQEEKANEEIKISKGRLRLQCSAPSALYLTAQGHEVLAGYGAAFDLQISEEMTARVVGDCRVYRHIPEATYAAPDDETYTNIDRMPDESGSVLAVTQATRAMKIAHMQMMQEIRQETAKLRAAQAAPAPSPSPAPDAQGEGQVVE